MSICTQNFKEIHRTDCKIVMSLKVVKKMENSAVHGGCSHVLEVENSTVGSSLFLSDLRFMYIGELGKWTLNLA